MTDFDGLLLIQLGSPIHADKRSIRSFLNHYLGDPHILGRTLPGWNFLLHYLIAPLRSSQTEERYADMVKNFGKGEMPLFYYTKSFTNGVREALKSLNIFVECAYQYSGLPSVETALWRLERSGARRIHVVPLYPQRSEVTTGATIDLVRTLLPKFSSMKIKVADGFASHPAWINNEARMIAEHCKGAHVLLSWHSLQKWRVEKGDPYAIDCKASTKAIGNELGKPVAAVYQSKFGFGKWLEPFTKKVLLELAQAHESVAIACPSFLVDNLETLYEMDVEAKDLFLKAGGKSFKRIPCLNDDPKWIHDFATKVIPELNWTSIS